MRCSSKMSVCESGQIFGVGYHFLLDVVGSSWNSCFTRQFFHLGVALEGSNVREQQVLRAWFGWV